jgi:hypothetical protein
MGDSALHDIKQLLQDVLSKVAILEGKMVTMEDGMKAVSTKVSAVDGEIAVVKADQGRLHVAINIVQSKHIEVVARLLGRPPVMPLLPPSAAQSLTQRLISCIF